LARAHAPRAHRRAAPQGRAAAQEAEVAEVAGLLGVSHGAAGLLLRSARWNTEDLLTKFMEDAEKVCRDAGVAMPGATAALVSAAPPAGGQRECMICREDATALSSLDCGHAYCDGCWVRYLGLKVEEGETQIRCPEHRCPLRVPEELVRRLCGAETVERYTFFLRKSFVDHSRTTVWCPVAGCSLAVDNSAGTQYVTCGAGHAFCAGCNQEPHAPASCDTVKAWLKKCDDDSETFNWLSINTQDCPKCKSTIEKNGGCNHMTCACRPRLLAACNGTKRLRRHLAAQASSASTSTAGCAWATGPSTRTFTSAFRADELRLRHAADLPACAAATASTKRL